MRLTLGIVVVTFFLSGFCLAKEPDPAKLWKKKCQSCHGADGRGNTRLAKFLGVPKEILDVTTEDIRQKGEATLLNIIHKGRGKMPGFANQLTSKKQRLVLEYMRSLAGGK